MFLFDSNSRIQKVAEGIKFYEQDVLCSSYKFTGDKKIDIVFDFIVPGFGIAIIEDNGQEDILEGSNNSYLYKLGSYSSKAYFRHFYTQTEIGDNSTLLGAGIQSKNTHITVEIIKDQIIFTWIIENKVTGEVRTQELTKFSIPQAFDNYYIGFYSSAENIIRSVKIYGLVPEHWHTSVKNTVGGEISFSRDAFTMNNCEHVAEIEQGRIQLKAGDYYLVYDKEDIGENPNDLVPVISKTKLDEYSDTDIVFEDEYQQMLDKKLHFSLLEDTEVNLKFKGKNGRISNLLLTDNPNSSFVETQGSAHYEKGSLIQVELDGISYVKFTAEILNVPPRENALLDSPYAIVETVSRRYDMDSFWVKLNEIYEYVYDVKNKKMYVKLKDSEEDAQSKEVKIDITEADNNILTLMNNVEMIMYSFTFTDEEGNEFDAIMQKTFKYYVPADIKSPILVTNTDNGETMDISASYREIVDPSTKFLLFSPTEEIFLPEELPTCAHDIKVYGIFSDAKINIDGKTIFEYAPSAQFISSTFYERIENVIAIKKEIRNSFYKIIVEYESIEDFSYFFTNYEREVFDNTSDILVLSKAISEDNEDVTIYAISKNSYIQPEYLYRVPNKGLINSIDYYAEKYDIIGGEAYSIDHMTNEIKLKTGTAAKYDHIVIDYLKKESCAINFLPEQNQYELDISTEEKFVNIHYDMRENGTIGTYKKISINPDSEKYIVLKKKGGL